MSIYGLRSADADCGCGDGGEEGFLSGVFGSPERRQAKAEERKAARDQRRAKRTQNQLDRAEQIGSQSFDWGFLAAGGGALFISIALITAVVVLFVTLGQDILQLIQGITGTQD
uniref:Uncharacterized protein n=1 Tax=viral metagenome TaxID=1070528 RepID=A0A2V0RBV0_9ZZZZ